MKVFLSYRRDDTGGRAGRLYDALARKYGQQRVFQDVSSATAGVDFTARIESTIAGSDAVLVVIGPNWLTSSNAGVRRIDESNDFVRREVSAALATDKPVVPVLVDGADLPRADELPPELAALVSRQAVTIRDTSWHQDVDGLIRQLEGETLPIGRRRRTGLIVAGAVAVVAIGVVTAFAVSNDDGGESSDALPNCSTSDEWTQLALIPSGPVDWEDDEGHEGTIELTDAWFIPNGDEFDIVVKVDVRNGTTEIADSTDDEIYVEEGEVDTLAVNDRPSGEPICFGDEGIDRQVKPDQVVDVSIGFHSRADPVGVRLKLTALDIAVEADPR